MFIKKKEYEELKGQLESAKSSASYYKKIYDMYKNDYREESAEVENQKKKVEELQKKNDELQHKIDILYAYYDIQKDPTQEERTKIRLDLRVHELEMENLELRAIVRSNVGYLQNELNQLKIKNSVYNVPWPYCNSNAGLIIC